MFVAAAKREVLIKLSLALNNERLGNALVATRNISSRLCVDKNPDL